MSVALRVIEGTGGAGRTPAPAPVTPPPPRGNDDTPSVPVTFISYLLAAGGFLVLLWHGMPYYRLSQAQRLWSPLHAQLRPNGSVGLLYGYVGTAMLLFLLVYSLRKRLRVLHRLGALRRWLNVHVFCGIAGPALITLHSSFKFGGIISIGYWSMMTVMASGFVGFYLYRQIPRALSNAAREAEDIDAELAARDRELSACYGLDEEQLRAVRRQAGTDGAAERGALASLVYLMTQDLRLRLGGVRVPAATHAERPLDKHELRQMGRLVRQRIVLERRRAFLAQTRTLFGYWHAIHKPFTICLFVMMFVHIAVAMWFGYATPQP